MLDIAFKYGDDLKKLYLDKVVGNDIYKYWSTGSYLRFNFHEMDATEWDSIQRVSLVDNKIEGYLEASVDRPNNYISNLSVLNFNMSKTGVILIKDLYEFVILLLNKYQFSKINFNVVIGNPAERIYDKFVERCNGRIVGIYKKDVKLIDQNLYDRKVYEILKEDFKSW